MTDFAKEIQDRWTAAEEADKSNREEAMLDLEFAAGDQWDDRVREQRESGEIPLPCLTINTIPQFVGQVIGDRRANATSIKVLPREDGDKQVAEVRSELIRSIELQSKAERCRSQAFEQQVTCGIGNTRIDLDYAYEDAFERDLFIRAIANPMAVLWDPMAADPTGRDAEYCFVQERIRKEDYKARFKAEPTEALNDSSLKSTGWVENETVRIAEFWKMTEKPMTLVMKLDGSVVDIKEAQPGEIAVNPSTGQPIQRESSCRYATRILTNGKEELEDPFELKIPRLPIIRWMGREVWVGDERKRFGLVRFARDPQRLKNYMRSVWAQKLMFAPRHNWMAEDRAIKGRQGDYSDVLTYNDQANPPVPMVNNQLRDFLTGAEVFAQDMKDTTGIHDASLGMKSNETSGVAIRNRQHEGDIATIIYHDNANAAMQEEGEVLNALIPVVYDTARTIRTVGQDDAIKLIRVNDPSVQDSINLGLGRYDTVISTGPAYMTKRLEAAASMMEASRSAPQLWEVAGDLMAKAQDWPGADEIAERVKRSIDPALLGADEKEQDDPEKAAEMAQQAQEAEALKQQMTMLSLKKATAEAEEAEAKARLAIKQAEDAENGLNKQSVDAYNAETSRVKAVTAKDFPLPPEAQAILAPLITQAVMSVLESPDILPFATQMTIAEGALDDALGTPEPTNDVSGDEAAGVAA